MLPLLLLHAGCDEDGPVVPPAPAPEAEASQCFKPATAGSIAGRVTWSGPGPVVPPFRSHPKPLTGARDGPLQDWPNPHAPRIGPDSGVGNAVVFLRGLDPRIGRPWDHPPVRVQVSDDQAHVLQGEADRCFGFVQRGDSFELASVENDFTAIQGRGAAFFARTFAPPCRPCQIPLPQSGVVELLSASGSFWLRAHLFVDDHPYYAPTGADGRFSLEGVPPGDHELVCWLPDWRPAERERDADTGLVWRLTFRPARLVAKRVRVAPGGKATALFVLGP